MTRLSIKKYQNKTIGLEQKKPQSRQRIETYRDLDVDQVEVVDLTITRLVLQCGGLRLDGYPTLFLEIHRVQYLL